MYQIIKTKYTCVDRYRSGNSSCTTTPHLGQNRNGFAVLYTRADVWIENLKIWNKWYTYTRLYDVMKIMRSFGRLNICWRSDTGPWCISVMHWSTWLKKFYAVINHYENRWTGSTRDVFFQCSSPIVDYEDIDIESERNKPRVPITNHVMWVVATI